MSTRTLSTGTKWLAIDDTAMLAREELGLYYTKPAVRTEPVLSPTDSDTPAPDNKGAFFYGTVLQEKGPFGGNFRMWYHACHWPMNPDWPPEQANQLANYDYPHVIVGPVCYAESEDGVHWFKPELNQVSFYGSTANNAVDLRYNVSFSVNVIRDDTDPDPERRYKMVYQACPIFREDPIPGLEKKLTAALAISADGIHWTEHMVPYPAQFFEHNSLYQFDGKYIIGAHTMAAGGQGSYRTEGGNNCSRIGIARYSMDFDHWVPGYVDAFSLPQPREPAKRNPKDKHTQVHMGVAAADVGGVCVGLYGHWRGAPEIHDATCDLGLVISNDGLHFREPSKEAIFLEHRDSPCKQHPERQFHTVMCQGNGILNVGDETWIYHGRWRNTGHHCMDKYHSEIALCTIPRDRWGALGIYPSFESGNVITEAFTADSLFTLNASGASGIQLSLLDEMYRPIDGFTGTPVGDDGLDLPITWERAPYELGNQPVRLQLTLTKSDGCEPRLFSLNGA